MLLLLSVPNIFETYLEQQIYTYIYYTWNIPICPIFNLEGLSWLRWFETPQAWAFQILSDPTGKSAIWAAQRLPDDHMTVVVSWKTIGVGWIWCMLVLVMRIGIRWDEHHHRKTTIWERFNHIDSHEQWTKPGCCLGYIVDGILPIS